MPARLIFIYNADSGLFNTLSDIAHKIFSPQTYACNLCALSHDYFAMRPAWSRFIAGLGADCEFLHRDQFRRRFPELDIELPAVLRQDATGVRVCLPAEAINRCRDLACLQQEIRDSCLFAGD